MRTGYGVARALTVDVLRVEVSYIGITVSRGPATQSLGVGMGGINTYERPDARRGDGWGHAYGLRVIVDLVRLGALDDVDRGADADVDEGTDVEETAAVEQVDRDVGNRGGHCESRWCARDRGYQIVQKQQ